MTNSETTKRYHREWMRQDRLKNPEKHNKINREWTRVDRLKNPAKYIARSRQWAATHDRHRYGTAYYRKYYPAVAARQTDRQVLLQRLKDRPCMDCGDWFPTCAMQFDHRDPATKLANLSRLRSSSVKKIMEEVAKCDIVCANCHFIRTASRKAKRYGWTKADIRTNARVSL